MALATAAAASAVATATTAGFAYLDAKYHLRQDLHYLRGKRLGRKLWEQAVLAQRTSPYYFIEANARAAPDHEAIWSRDGCYTRREMYERANQYGQWFLAQGVRPGDLVGFFMANSPDFVTAWLGLLAIGAAPAMLNHQLPGPALLHCRAISGATLVVVAGPADVRARLAAVEADLVGAGCRVVALDDAAVRADVYGRDARRPGDELRAGVQGDWPLALFYTSGTTGLPKACPLPIVVAFGHGVATVTGLNPVRASAAPGAPANPRYYNCMPFYHGTGGINGMAQVLAGTTLCVGRKFSTSGFWTDVRDARASWFVYVGETLRYLLAAPPSADDRCHGVYGIHGNGLRPDVWERFRERFGITCVTEFFNSTEGVFPLENACRGPFLAHAVGHHGLLRRWWHRNDFAAVEADPATGDLVRDARTGAVVRRPFALGGEILVRQPPDGRAEHAFVGYTGDGRATEGKLVRDVFRKGDCYYRTGDALRRDPDGRWFFLDRLGDTFRWKGENVATAAVAEVLGRFPGVLEANVYGVDLPGHDGKAGAAAVLLASSPSTPFDHAALLAHCRKHLPRYAVPLFLRHIQQTIATHNNKQNKLPLKKEGVDPDKTTNGDRLLWVADHGKGTTYVPFTRADWADLQAGRARL